MFSILVLRFLSQTPQFMTPATMGDKFVLLMVLFVIQIVFMLFQCILFKVLKNIKNCITISP
jgi:hypothetical protein